MIFFPHNSENVTQKKECEILIENQLDEEKYKII